MDHKAVFDGDEGPNTGGMGTISPSPFVGPALDEEIMRTIIRPTIDRMAEEGRPYKGALYAGLMLTDDGPKVLEYNCRFGDPETQPQMLRLESDLVEILTRGRRTGRRRQATSSGREAGRLRHPGFGRLSRPLRERERASGCGRGGPAVPGIARLPRRDEIRERPLS